jgi:hypothetical protein
MALGGGFRRFFRSSKDVRLHIREERTSSCWRGYRATSTPSRL